MAASNDSDKRRIPALVLSGFLIVYILVDMDRREEGGMSYPRFVARRWGQAAGASGASDPRIAAGFLVFDSVPACTPRRA